MKNILRNPKVHAAVGRAVLGLLGLGIISAVMAGVEKSYRQTNNDTVISLSQDIRRIRAKAVNE